MAIGAFIPLAVFVVILGSVGIRLMRLWSRTRELPELTLGLGLVIMSGSMPLFGVGRAPALAMGMTGRVCFALAVVAIWVAVTLMMFFTYWVFRRGSGGAGAVLASVSIALAAAVVYMAIQNFAGDSISAIKPKMRPGTLALMGTIFAAFAWGSAESLRYWAALRRQLALGLGDPVLVDRFWLWGVASATGSVLLVVIIACVMAGMTIMHEPLPLAAIAASGSVMSLAWWLTFFAPEGYLRWVRARAARSS